MKKIIPVVLFLFTSYNSMSQNHVWSIPKLYFEDGNVLQFNSTTPSNYNGQQAKYVHNAMQDENKRLKFFIVDGEVFNKDGITAGFLSFGQAMGPETVIVPDPSDCEKFYIFYSLTSANLPGAIGSEPYMAVLDFTVPPPFVTSTTSLGNLTPSNVNFGNEVFQNGFITMASTDLNSNNERFVYIQLKSKIVYYKVGSTGVSYVGEFPIGTYVNPNNIAAPILSTNVQSEMEVISLNSTTNRIAFPFRFTFNVQPFQIEQYSGVYYGDVAKNTGAPINSNYFLYPNDNNYGLSDKNYIHGLEFDQTGKYLYLTHNITPTVSSAIDVIDVTNNSNPVALTTLNPTITNETDFQNSMIEFYTDNKLYFATSDRLASLTDPFNPGVGTWSNTAINFNSLGFSYNSVFPLFPSNAPHTYLLPDQIDLSNYRFSYINTSLFCCIKYSDYEVDSDDNNNEFAVSGSWSYLSNPWSIPSGRIRVKDKMIIKAGTTISINNMEFEFAPEAQLIVERGATLILNGCLLTSNEGCDNNAMWHGIEVWGTTSGFQPNLNNSGRLIINNTTLENAIVGIANARHNQDPDNKPIENSFNKNYNRGIILATKNTFRNNYKDVQFNDYISTNGTQTYNDMSYFDRCEFITDARLNKANLHPYRHVMLRRVRGINFTACKFLNAILPANQYIP